jgi:Mechanosensitive ion channel
MAERAVRTRMYADRSGGGSVSIPAGEEVPFLLHDPGKAGKLVRIAQVGTLRRVVHRVFAALVPRGSDGMLTERAMVQRGGLREEEATMVLQTLDAAVEKEVSRRELVAAALQVLRDTRGLGQSLELLESATAALRLAVRIVWALVSLVATLLIFQVDVSSFFVGLAAVLVAASVAVGDPLRNLIQSVVFVLFYRQFEVGDLLHINDDVEDAEVVEINVLTTTLRDLYNVCFTVPNHVLVDSRICNLRRSPDAVMEVSFRVGYRTSPEQLDKLVAGAIAWVRMRPHVWNPAHVYFYVFEADLQGADSGPTMRIAFWLCHRMAHQEVMTTWADMATFRLAALQIMQRLGIECPQQPLPVALVDPSALLASIPNVVSAPSVTSNLLSSPPSNPPSFLRSNPNVTGRRSHDLRDGDGDEGGTSASEGASAAEPTDGEEQGGEEVGGKEDEEEAEEGGEEDGGEEEGVSSVQGSERERVLQTSERERTFSQWDTLGVVPEDEEREERVRRFDARAFAEQLNDCRTGAVAHTWTVDRPLAERSHVMPDARLITDANPLPPTRMPTPRSSSRDLGAAALAAALVARLSAPQGRGRERSSRSVESRPSDGAAGAGGANVAPSAPSTALRVPRVPAAALRVPADLGWAAGGHYNTVGAVPARGSAGRRALAGLFAPEQQ